MNTRLAILKNLGHVFIDLKQAQNLFGNAAKPGVRFFRSDCANCKYYFWFDEFFDSIWIESKNTSVVYIKNCKKYELEKVLNCNELIIKEII